MTHSAQALALHKYTLTTAREITVLPDLEEGLPVALTIGWNYHKYWIICQFVEEVGKQSAHAQGI